MLEMILLLLSACGLVIAVCAYDRKLHQRVYIVDNLSIGECRKYTTLEEAYNIWKLCLEDGHEAYLKRVLVS